MGERVYGKCTGKWAPFLAFTASAVAAEATLSSRAWASPAVAADRRGRRSRESSDLQGSEGPAIGRSNSSPPPKSGGEGAAKRRMRGWRSEGWMNETPPHPAFGHLLPHSSVGEKSY